MSMTFLQLQNELISVPSARFKESQRPSVQRWLNAAYAEFWNADDWTFRQATATVAVTAGSQTVTSLPADFGTALALHRADGQRVNYLKPTQFRDLYQGTTTTGLPDDYTIVNGTLSVGPVSSETSGGYSLLYEKALTLMSGDNDVPALPAEYHYSLVFGASVLGLVQEQDFTFQFAQGMWANAIESAKLNYLDDQRGQPSQWGSWSAGYGSYGQVW